MSRATGQSPACDGSYHVYAGGTKLEDAADSINGKATISVGPYATPKTFTWIKDNYSGKHVSMPMPILSMYGTGLAGSET